MEHDMIRRPGAKAGPPFAGERFRERSGASVDLDSNWLITLSDVLSLLLIFYVMFFAATKADTPPVPERPPGTSAESPDGTPSRSQAIADEMNRDIRMLELDGAVAVRAVDKEVIVTLKEKVVFRPGEAEVLASSLQMLDRIAGIIERRPDFSVEIDGHTDNIPIHTRLYPSNWELSVARAVSVLRYFINRHDVDPSRLSIKGNADQKPLVANDTAEHRAQNRRVEIRMKEQGG